jgi:hypothetical protein
VGYFPGGRVAIVTQSATAEAQAIPLTLTLEPELVEILDRPSR